MSRNVLTPTGQLVSATDPAGPSLRAGDTYFNTTINALKVYNGSSWNVVSSNILPTNTVAPTGPVQGQTYFDTVLKQLLIWNGTSWQLPDGTIAHPGGTTSTTYPSSTLFPSSQTYPGVT